jgi:hypothetical protein
LKDAIPPPQTSIVVEMIASPMLKFLEKLSSMNNLLNSRVETSRCILFVIQLTSNFGGSYLFRLNELGGRLGGG